MLLSEIVLVTVLYSFKGFFSGVGGNERLTKIQLLFSQIVNTIPLSLA